MNKNILIGLGIAGLGYLAYKFMLNPSQNYTTTSMNPNSNPTYGNQNGYPFQAAIPPRMDNSNQPWANNNRGAIAQVSMPQTDVNLSNVQMIADYAKSAASIGNSLTSIWEDFGISDWFSSGDADAFMADQDYGGWDVNFDDSSDYGSYV